MIIGHQKQRERLRLLFEEEKIPHALLFAGPRNIGKRTVALDFLKAVNCLQEGGGCSSCRSCYEITEGIHPDIIQITPEKKEIQLHQIEEVIERVSFKGLKARFKGVIIDNAHLMNLQAQNSLLKVLEEPPAKTLIILVSEYPRMLLPTITSRTFHLGFSFVPEKEIAKKIQDEEAVSISSGRPGEAVRYSHSLEERKKMKEKKEEAMQIMKGDVAQRFSLTKKIAKEERVEEFLCFLLKTAAEEMKKKLNQGKETKDYREAIKEIERAVFLSSKTNINQQLVLEKIAIKLP